VVESGETALLRETLGEWVLTTLKSGADTAAGTGVLTFGTTAGSFAVAGTDTATDALLIFGGF